MKKVIVTLVFVFAIAQIAFSRGTIAPVSEQVVASEVIVVGKLEKIVKAGDGKTELGKIIVEKALKGEFDGKEILIEANGAISTASVAGVLKVGDEGIWFLKKAPGKKNYYVKALEGQHAFISRKGIPEVEQQIEVLKKAEKLLTELLKSYEEDSDKSLSAFFEKWQTEVKAIDLSKLEDEAVKDVYAVYKEFFRPYDLSSVGKSEWGGGIYKDVKYYVVQNTINYRYEGGKDKKNITVKDFRPDVGHGDVKPVFLIDEYRHALNSFLKNEHIPFAKPNIMNPARAKGESAKRLGFLGKMVKIFHGHWGGYWHIETHPQASIVIFDKDRTKATVHFRLVYQGGEAKLEKKDGKWVLKESKLTWIE